MLIEHFCCFETEKSAPELADVPDELVKNKGYDKGYSKNDIVLITA